MFNLFNNSMTLEQIKETLQGSGQIFGAEYVKASGEATRINGRFGVKKYLKGTGKASDKVWCVWDNNRKRYTSLKPERIQSITLSGITHKIRK